MTRVIRLIRLIRIVKLYKSANQALVNEEEKKHNKNNLDPMEQLNLTNGDKMAAQAQDINIQELLMKDQKESVVGKKLLDQTTRRVILLVLAMLFSVPVFSVSSYLPEPTSFKYGLSLIKELGPETAGGRLAFEDTIALQTQLDTPLIKLYVEDKRNGAETLIWENYDVDIANLRD